MIAVAGTVLAAAPAMAAAPGVSGKVLYGGCVACHGARGEGVAAVGAPSIAGLSTTYLVRQLRNFSTGARGATPGDNPGTAMRAAVAAITGEDQRVALAAYVAALPRTRTPAPAVDSPQGRNYFNALCSACHGSDGAGNESLAAPRLAGQPAGYLERQLLAFRAGRRGARDGDREGAQMRSIANMVPDDATVREVSRYAAALGTR